ncbi:ABC transporter substrate-binding protein [Actinoallomurus purpureus]|uniref:ABC transporter substrate-binding protein n=1 Tax=Actinoallomurus purpureus TaxID=478114 RepID=UPI0020929DC0|nr:ABC transporter substrate-binding protein [Actinoallomurus purpureus]MCO6006882.1 ABC transporter substrate-binding protein [Actinoallomurus purpureus]
MNRLSRSLSRGTRMVAVAAGALLAVTACGSTKGHDAAGTAGSPAQVSIALGWTPNTDYTGIYVADSLGYFKKQGISLKVIPYASTAPETLVAHGTADFGFSYQAGVAYAKAAGHDVIGVFAPDQKGTYVIGVRSDRADIASPKDLDGKTYAGFGTPDELPELQSVIRHDGGRGTFNHVTLNTSAYDAVYNGKADFTISVATWEVLQSKLVGKPMKSFKLTDYGFPDQYSNLIVSSSKYLTAHADLARRFLAATQQGYAYAADHPQEAAKILIAANPSVFPKPDLVYQSQAALAAGGYLRNAKGQVGTQSASLWSSYGDFLYGNGLLVDGDGKKLAAKPDWSTYYTNDYLPAGSR